MTSQNITNRQVSLRDFTAAASKMGLLSFGGSLFILPGAIVIFILALAYMKFG